MSTVTAGSVAPVRRVPWRARSSDRPWPPATHMLVVLTGVVLAGVTFLGVLNMPDLPYHPARDAELHATYEAYLQTGVPLVKENGTGSWYGTVEGEGMTRAAGDDDPGSYLIASWMSHLTGSDSPYPGLRWVMALVCALPLLILPVTVARVFGRARAGLAMLALPLVTWLVNKGTVLVGTEYGLSDQVSPVRVYALYGLPAAVIFLSLVLLAHAVSRRPRPAVALAVTVLLVGLATASNLLRSMSGVGIALAIGVLWWVTCRGRWRLLIAGSAAATCLLAAMWLPGVIMDRIDAARAEVISPSLSHLPDAHGLWHPLYLGLSYPQPITGTPSTFGVVWSDELGWQKAREIDPDVVVASAEYDAIMNYLYLDEVRSSPLGAARLYLEKTLYTLKHFAAMILLAILAAVLVWRRPGPHRATSGQMAAIAVPTLAMGMLPPVLVMPMLYYYTELTAGLGLLSAMALGGLVWAITTLPSYVRVAERRMVQARMRRDAEQEPEKDLTAIIPTRNGADVLPETLDVLGRHLTERDEIVVVENGSTDATPQVLAELAAGWAHACELVVHSSEPGLGNALRTGVLASRGGRLLLTADDLPFGMTDLGSFRRLPHDVVVAIGSKAHPGSLIQRSGRRALQSRVFRWLRSALLHSEVGDSQGTLWVDGAWTRSFAAVSRETGLMWTVELVLAAEQQGLDVFEVPVVLREQHDKSGSRFRLRDAFIAVREIWQLALRKDDYTGAEWLTPGRVLATSPTSGTGVSSWESASRVSR